MKVIKAFEPLYKEKYRYFVFYGGRGGGKTEAVADYLLWIAQKKRTNILCGRETQNSIRDSVYATLKKKILEKRLTSFRITREIITHLNGSQFIFKPLSPRCHNALRGLNDFHIVWIEEAQFLSQDTIDSIRPTLRGKGSFFILTGNPFLKTDPFSVEFILKKENDIYQCRINYDDNPFFPHVLEKERERCLLFSQQKYNHIWLGDFLQFKNNSVFKNKFQIVDYNFYEKINNDSGYTAHVGMDWGFAEDPTVLICVFFNRKKNHLLIFKELFLKNCPVDKIAESIDALGIPSILQNKTIRADCSRPDLIELVGRSFKIAPCKKPKNSVTAGIDFLLSLDKIEIHKDCKNTIHEFQNFSYREKIISSAIFQDGNDHSIDSIRYALEDFIFPEREKFDYSKFA